MPVQYKIDVLAALKEAGYTTYKMRREKLLGESVLQQLRKGDLVSWTNLSRICFLLQLQPGDILEYIPCEKDVFVFKAEENSNGPRAC